MKVFNRSSSLLKESQACLALSAFLSVVATLACHLLETSISKQKIQKHHCNNFLFAEARVRMSQQQKADGKACNPVNCLQLDASPSSSGREHPIGSDLMR